MARQFRAVRLERVRTRSDHDAVIAVRLDDTVAAANIKATLTPDEAEGAVYTIIEAAAGGCGGLDALILLEWYRKRRKVLRRIEATTSLRFHTAPGGCPVGVDHIRFKHIRTRGVLLAGAGRVDKSPGRRRFLGPNISTLVIAEDRVTGDEWAFLGYHLTAEVEHDARDRDGDGYRDDRPLRVRRHKRERRKLNKVARKQARGRRRGPKLLRRPPRHVRFGGDSNLDRMPIDGLTSAWEGREHAHGTRGGRRKIDDVQAGGPR